LMSLYPHLAAVAGRRFIRITDDIRDAVRVMMPRSWRQPEVVWINKPPDEESSPSSYH